MPSQRCDGRADRAELGRDAAAALRLRTARTVKHIRKISTLRARGATSHRFGAEEPRRAADPEHVIIAAVRNHMHRRHRSEPSNTTEDQFEHETKKLLAGSGSSTYLSTSRLVT